MSEKVVIKERSGFDGWTRPAEWTRPGSRVITATAQGLLPSPLAQMIRPLGKPQQEKGVQELKPPTFFG